MIRQIYRFLSIVLISNLVFSAAAFGKSGSNTDSIIATESNDTFNEQENINNQKFIKKNPDLEKMPPYIKDSGRFTTIYGVMNTNDFFNSYPKPKKTRYPSIKEKKK
ncbi:MAG: hypothetical protein PHC34_11880 [Candidatus Gastranaerophilales bacterium]|nr:hypothetical protein [Candidatus Gastranaerophilales bacterium]